MALFIKIKKPWGPVRLTHGFHSIALGSEAWVNPPKAKKEKVFVKPGHHSLIYIFYYLCNKVKNEMGAGLKKGLLLALSGYNPLKA
jgi:hypothetical protein